MTLTRRPDVLDGGAPVVRFTAAAQQFLRTGAALSPEIGAPFTAAPEAGRTPRRGSLHDPADQRGAPRRALLSMRTMRAASAAAGAATAVIPENAEHDRLRLTSATVRLPGTHRHRGPRSAPPPSSPPRIQQPRIMAAVDASAAA